jgi:flagellin-like protein
MVKKAISPIVAVVVLVGIAIMLGGLISSWIGSFVDESSKTGTCPMTTMYTISDAEVNETSGLLTVTLRNTGKDDIYNFSLEVDNGTLIELLQATSPSDTYILVPSRTQYIRTNITNQNITTSNITNIDTVTILTRSCPDYAPAAIKVENI